MARKGRGQLSAIERLPDECSPIITWAATELQNRDRTQTEIYQEFFLKMQELQAEHKGELEFVIPSFSAFNRYSIKLAMMTRRLEDTREIAATISKRFDAQSSDDLTLIAAEAIKTLVFELLTDAGESGLAPIGAMQLATALKMASQAQSVSTQRRATVAKEFKADVEKAVDTVAKSKGMSAETADAIKAQILGVRTS
ncbi:MAG: DUF3486 family protein [Mesorhizobium sp.]|uniref:DUF3486 family protein n=1 Tax=Mesorhizobium sp. TaxID=1871066 RepID=UPI000FEA301C|nr:DUF3486 family protein [Mesorhizobium sp.]RWE78534.1 MAG: DUF3486 family protein [Mesorhizobium sp.]TJW61016.1 MAG: DUF3486 family protein [Mesorhizobium sp.]